MTYQSSTNLYQNTKYVVDAVAANSPYNTIQSALDAANAAGVDAEVFVRPGTYIENLTLYSNVIIRGSVLETVITGNHTPPATGICTLKDLYLTAASGDILSSAGAGTGILLVENCYITVVNGYVFNIPNWAAGTIALINCTDASTNNGVINCTGGANALISSSYAGRGSGNALTFSNGNLDIISTRLGCPISIAGTGATTINEGSSLQGTLTTGGSNAATVTNTKIVSGATQAITHSSSSTLTLANTNINTSNATAIGGTGTIEFGSVTFLDSNVIAGTITESLTSIHKTGESHAENIQDMVFTGRLSWGGAGVYYSVAATAVTIERPGTGYIRGKKVTWAGSQSTGALSTGNTHYIYVDSTGTIGTTTTRSLALYQDQIVLFEALVDPASTVIVVREDHPYDFETGISEWAHDTFGAIIANKSGGANIALNGTKGIQIDGADELEDHGLETDIPDSGATAVTFTFMFTDGSGKWTVDSTANTFASEYNNAGVVAALGSNKYGVFRLYVSKSDLNTAIPTYYAVLDITEYNNRTAAVTAIANGSPAAQSAEFAALELAQLGYVVKEESSDTITDVIIEKSTAGGGVSVVSPSIASLVVTDTTNFDGWLSASDTTVQAALETLDEYGKGVIVDPGASGDSYIRFDINTTTEFSVGVDDTDSDNFKITTGATPSAGTEVMEITPSGDATFPGNVSIANGSASAATPLDVVDAVSGTDLTVRVRNTSNTASSSAHFEASTGGTSSADPYLKLEVSGGSAYAFGIDNSDSDALKIVAGGDPSSAPIYMKMFSTGEQTLPLQSAFSAYPSGNLPNVTGDGTLYTIIYNTEIFDQNSDFNTGTGTYTSPVTSKVVFGGCAHCVNFTSNNTSFDYRLVTSNRTYVLDIANPFAQVDVTLGYACNFHVIADMDSGDTATTTLEINATDKTVTLVATNTRFYGSIIC